MADAALFVGFGTPIPGRERQALAVFNEAVAYYTRLQGQGEIESFEPVLLEPHGGDLGGFLLLRGEPDALHRVRHSAEFERVATRAGLVVQGFGIVGAAIGEGLARGFARFEANLGDLAG